MKKILIGFLLGASVFAALNYHFILASGRMVVERKSEMGLTDTFVDTGDWTVGDYAAHPGIAAILAKRGIKRLVGADDGLAEAGKEALEKTSDRIGGRK